MRIITCTESVLRGWLKQHQDLWPKIAVEYEGDGLFGLRKFVDGNDLRSDESLALLLEAIFSSVGHPYRRTP